MRAKRDRRIWYREEEKLNFENDTIKPKKEQLEIKVEEIEEFKKQIEAMKGKIAGADKAAFDMKKLKD